jgi:hypothetical protein
MLGRKTYTREEVDHARTTVREQLAAYHALAEATNAPDAAPGGASALDAFETLFFNNMTIVLDRCFVHRVRLVTGKDGNPLNEVEVLSDSLISNGGVLAATTVVKLVPDQSVLKLRPGDRIAITAGDFDLLSAAFFAELEKRFVTD